jgi:hypothetical protein
MKKQDIRRAILLLLVQLLIVPTVLLMGAFALPEQYGETFLGELPAKYERLTTTEGRRIIVIGGSSAAFGLRSDLIQQELPNYETVNFGLYASLGTKVMLDLSKDQLREGDIVLIAPEQDPQTLSLYFGAQAVWQGLDGHFELLGKLQQEDWGNMVGALPTFAVEKIRSYVTRQKPMPEGVYARASFNSFGEIEYADCNSNRMEQGYDPNTPIRFSPEVVGEGFCAYLNEYAEKATAQGAQVYYYFCPMNALAVEEVDALEDYYNWLGAQLSFPILGNPEHAVLDAEWFYDTNFHLNQSGAILYTKYLIRDIKLVLGDSSPTEIPDPIKPALAQAEQTKGDSTDADCFYWEVGDGSVTLTGLTEKGKAAETITIPVTCDGLPVTGFTAEVFRENRVIREIVIQDNIHQIADRSFNGCSQLERLVLESNQPSKCAVGAELLAGTNCKIYVPESAVSDYQTNYFWQQYAMRIESAKLP